METTHRNLKVYFPNLNGLRFIAACFVIVNHVEQLKRFYGIETHKLPDSAKNIGKLGVMLFFALSGFLITYLLLEEERSFKKIYAQKFYIRRFLRIVPLYFLVIFIVYFVIQPIGFFKIPNMANPVETHFYTTLALHIVFLPNLITAIYGFLPYIAQAWSIGTEEQAYLLWPVLLKRFQKNRILLMLGIIGFYFLVRILFWLPLLSSPYKEVLKSFWNHFNIDVIAIGGLFAVLLFQKNKVLSILLNTKLFYAVVFITLLMLFFGVSVPYFHYQTYGVLFGLIILNLASNTSLKNALEWKPISYLGRISYGIYMCHFMVLIPVLVLLVKLKLTTNWVIYPMVLTGTIAISSFSYHFFERRFLQKKAKFTLVKSGGSNF